MGSIIGVLLTFGPSNAMPLRRYSNKGHTAGNLAVGSSRRVRLILSKPAAVINVWYGQGTENHSFGKAITQL
jgi:hypothetical protein